jgi:hypothetical protein
MGAEAAALLALGVEAFLELLGRDLAGFYKEIA